MRKIKIEKKRDLKLDIAKGIAIILMVLGHSDGTGLFTHFVSLFHMVVFIFVSGCVYKEVIYKNVKDFFKDIIKKTKKIYLFYLKWELIFYSLTNVFFKFGFYNENTLYGGKIIKPISSLSEYLKNLIKIIIGMGREPFCGAFWFLISLIFIIIIYSFIKLITQKLENKEFICFCIVLVFFVLGMIMSYIETINIRRIGPAFSLLLFYYLGNYCYKNDKMNFNNIYIFILSIITLLILNNFGSIGINNNRICNPIFYISCSIAGIYFILFISKKLEKFKFANILSYLGAHTLPILALHLLSFKVVMMIQYKLNFINFSELSYLNGANNTNIGVILLYTFAGILIPIFFEKIVEIIKKYIIYKVNA